MVDDRTFPSSKVESDQDVSVENNTLPLLPAIYVNEIISGNFQGVQLLSLTTNIIPQNKNDCTLQGPG